MGKPTQKTADYIRHMFSVYDQDKNQFIDFKYELNKTNRSPILTFRKSLFFLIY